MAAGCAENGTTHFAKGMCKTCYLQYMETSGGHQHGAHPPAYARALQLADEEWQQQVRCLILDYKHALLAEGTVSRLFIWERRAMNESCPPPPPPPPPAGPGVAAAILTLCN